MISRWVRLEKFFNYLLVFLLPTQLALHFWPSFAFVFGTRVDYLSPSIYLTDLLFLTVFALWIRKAHKQVLEFIDKNKKYIFLFAALMVVNIIFSTSIFPSIYKWIKLIEMAAFCFYVWARDDIFKSKVFFLTLFYSLILFSTIGILQFIFGKTLGGPLYYLGERSFNISTPRIALVEIFGRNFMRVYSTFSHPNSLAGYLGVGTLIFLFAYSKKDFVKKGLGIMIICIAFVLTFSLSAIFGIAVCAILYLLDRKELFNKKNIIFIPSAFFLISLSLPFASKIALQSKLDFPQNISQRLEMSLAAGSVISQKFLLGEGLNNFVISGSKIGYMGYYLWILQPVHNTVLLIFSETGIFGLLLFYLLITRSFRRSLLLNNKAMFLTLIFILTTGLLDHYWFTLQQNMFLFAYILGNLFKEKS